MSLLVTGSIATDHLMSFPGQVRRLAGRRPARQDRAVLPRRRPGGTARRAARPTSPSAWATSGCARPRRRGRRGLRRLPLLAGAAQRRLRLGARLADQAHRPLRVHQRLDDGPDRVVLRRRDERGPRDRARADRGPGRRGDYVLVGPNDPEAMLRHTQECRRPRLPVHRRPEPAARVRRRRDDPGAHRRRDDPVQQRVRVGADRAEDRLDRRGGARAASAPRWSPSAPPACAWSARARSRSSWPPSPRSTRSSRPASATRSAPASSPPSSGTSPSSAPPSSAACSRSTSWSRSAPRSTPCTSGAFVQRFADAYGDEAAAEVAAHVQTPRP